MSGSKYYIGSRSLEETLENNFGRLNSEIYFVGFRENYNVSGVNSNVLKYANYVSSYHPFRTNTNINNYFINYYTDENGYINKNYIHKGGAPLLNLHSEFNIDFNDDIEYWWNTPDSASIYDNGTLKVYYSTSNEPEAQSSCPSSIVVAVIGAGGGGAGGSGFIQKKRSYGGGSGAIVIANIQMPYGKNYGGPVFKIITGAGGIGGGTRSSGERGGTTTFYMYDNNSWTKMFDIPGAVGGEFVDRDIVYSPSEELAITRARISYQEFTASTGAKFSINTSCRNFDWGSGTFNYIPGDYYNPAMNDKYWQCDYTDPIIVSSLISENGKIISLNSKPSSYYVDNNGNYAFWGRYSRYGKSQTPPYNSKNTYNYYIGTGGSGGQSSTNIFDANLSGGARGGSGGVRIYW